MGKNILCCAILPLFHDVFVSVLDVDSLGIMIHTLPVQVIDGQGVSWHRFIHYLLDAARVTICQGDDVHETVPWNGAHIIVEGAGRNVERGYSDRRILKQNV